MTQTRRIKGRMIGLAVAFITFCVILLANGISSYLVLFSTLGGLVAYFIYRRPLVLTSLAIGIGSFAFWLYSCVWWYKIAEKEWGNPWIGLPLSLTTLIVIVKVDNKIEKTLYPFADREIKWIEGRENEPPPKLAVEWMAEEMEKRRLEKEKENS